MEDFFYVYLFTGIFSVDKSFSGNERTTTQFIPKWYTRI